MYIYTFSGALFPPPQGRRQDSRSCGPSHLCKALADLSAKLWHIFAASFTTNWLVRRTTNMESAWYNMPNTRHSAGIHANTTDANKDDADTRTLALRIMAAHGNLRWTSDNVQLKGRIVFVLIAQRTAGLWAVRSNSTSKEKVRYSPSSSPPLPLSPSSSLSLSLPLLPSPSRSLSPPLAPSPSLSLLFPPSPTYFFLSSLSVSSLRVSESQTLFLLEHNHEQSCLRWDAVKISLPILPTIATSSGHAVFIV